MDFFATSHRKSVCDGFGGAIKRLAAHASLQHPFSNQIIFPKQLFDFAEASLDGTTSSSVSSEENVSNTEFAKLWFATSSIFEGTWSHHKFFPIASSLTLTVKNTLFVTHSKDVSLAEAGRSKMQMMIEDMKLGKFFVCQYDNDWYFLVVNYLSSEHGDVNMIFLHPKGPSEKVSWPQCDSTCWIPIEYVNCKLIKS